jgi:hypothetical protein
MNKKFLVLGVVMSILMASMTFFGCDNGSTDPGSGEKVVAEQYRGTWKANDGTTLVLTESTLSYTYGTTHSEYEAWTEGTTLKYMNISATTGGDVEDTWGTFLSATQLKGIYNEEYTKQ